MEKLDLNLINQKIDKRSLDTWQMYQKKTQTVQDEVKTKNTESDSMVVNNKRDASLDSLMSKVKESVNLNTTAATGLDKIKEKLESLRTAAEKMQSDNTTASEKASLQKSSQTSLSEIDKVASDTKVNDTKMLEDFNLKSLGLSDIDLTSKDALSKIDKALSAVKSSTDSYQTKLDKNADSLASLNAKKELYGKADKLVQSLESQISSDPLAAIATQTNGMNTSSISTLLGAL